MKKTINVKFSWGIFLLIPIGILVFVIIPELRTKYEIFNNKRITLQQEMMTLDSLKQLQDPKPKDMHLIKSLEIKIPIHKVVHQRETFLYYKTGGMLLVLIFMGIGMAGSSYIAMKKKTSSGNKEVDFVFGNPDNDTIGQEIDWGALESSGSNFASEILKKTVNGYKITSSSLTKIIAWSFFLMGLNYVVISFIEFYRIYDVPLGLMKAGKLFFTSGGPFLLVGIILLFVFSPKVYVNRRNGKILIKGEMLSFQDVYALQILKKFVEGNTSGGFFGYELNLITKEGRRYNLLNHGDKDYILSDMVKLSRVFKVPVWNKGIV